MERVSEQLTPTDELFLQRAYELAARGIGNTAPNPPVGALIVREGRVVGEGYHHRAGDAHAETYALAQAGSSARGATVYVSLEPCRHVGRTPPCTRSLIDAGVARVVAGTLDPTHPGGAEHLRESGIDVAVANDATAQVLIETFARVSLSDRPYVGLKMAMSLDGAVASRPGVRERLGSEAEVRYVRELRIAYDAVMVGAGTVRVDDPVLTVRPTHDRLRGYKRIVACASAPISGESRIFARDEGYAATIVLAPAGLRDRFVELEVMAEVLYVGAPDAVALDLRQAMKDLRARGIFSVLCEGGPKLAASLIAGGFVDRVYWAIVPRFLANEAAVPVLAGTNLSLAEIQLRFDRVERAGDDVIISGILSRERCSADS
ncbi:MAG: bifunctional diaminohydroxyphosphoribosylaminopyrimidine deaminase/5-amino-6-(5-phosphoribosylamino)uracil reductase RibD [Candidatus Cybelea sp.]